MTKHPHAEEPDRPASNEQDRVRQPDSVEDVFRRVAASLRVPLETLALEYDAGRDGIPAVTVAQGASAPLIRVGATVLTATQASILARRVRRAVAQQRAHGYWSLMRTLVWARVVDLAADARYGLTCVATDRSRRRGGAR